VNADKTPKHRLSIKQCHQEHLGAFKIIKHFTVNIKNTPHRPVTRIDKYASQAYIIIIEIVHKVQN